MSLSKYVVENTNIIAKTIRMQSAIILPDGKTKREIFNKNKINQNLVLQETFLRKLAYKTTSIKTGASFFDDSDMISEYYLVVVYDESSNTPLLSARYYFDKSVISNYLNGYVNIESKKINNECKLNLNDFKKAKIFLADRLSGNLSSFIYRHCRNYIFSLFYKEIVSHNKDCKLILMARKEKHEKLLKKYLFLGFDVIGSKVHNEKEHWILLTDLKKSML